MTAQSPAVGIVVSRADSASVHIGAKLRSLAEWTTDVDESRPDQAGGGTVHRTEWAELREFDDLHLYLKEVAAPFSDPDLVVFASRHSGDTGPLLSGHFTGNFGPADYGGREGDFAQAAPNALAVVLDALQSHAPAEYEVSMECTHHGPTDVGAPSLFVELGSGESQWEDPAGAEAVARAILSLRGAAPDRDRQIVGFGGGHYAPRFGRVIRETDWAVGHVIADWSLRAVEDLDPSRIRRVFERSEADRALIDGEYPELTRRIEAMNHDLVSETWLRETTGVPLALVDWIEATLGPIGAGVRVGTQAREWKGHFEDIDLVTLHSDLVDAVNGVDHATALAAVREETLAFQTADGGSRAVGRIAIIPDGAPEGSLEDLIARIVSLLDRHSQGARIEDDVVVIRERAFDPDAARSLGVPEGPAFGQLSAGESVEIDGQVVDPDAVHIDRTTRIPVLADVESDPQPSPEDPTTG